MDPIRIELDQTRQQLDRIKGEIDHLIHQLQGATEDDILEIRIGDSVFRRVRSLPPVSPERILETVARNYGITVDTMRSMSRQQHIAHPRQVAIYLLKERLEMSYSACASAVGLNDQSTARHAHLRIRTMVNARTPEGRKVLQVIEELKADA